MVRQARSLDVLLGEVNAAHGERSKVSDGGLGDAAHSARESDHNVNSAGVWRARDFTNDLVDDNRDGDDFDMFDCDELAEALVAMYHEKPVHPAMGSGAYTIWEGRIYSYDRRHEGWRPYGGSNGHFSHLHQSVATRASGYDSTAPWGVMEDKMNKAQADLLRKIGDMVEEQGRDMESLKNRFNRFANNSWERDKKMIALARDTNKTADQILAEVDGK